MSDDLELVIPFYDSFIFNNNFYLKKCVPDFHKIPPTFWLENNGLPFDGLVGEKVLKFAQGMARPVKRVKTILYKNREDAEALQTYKILCNRNFGRAASLNSQATCQGLEVTKFKPSVSVSKTIYLCFLSNLSSDSCIL